jgi:hypothetical protein
MARTIAEISQGIIQEKDAQPALAGLNSPSQVAIWRLWIYVTAAAIWAHEKLWDIFYQDVLEKISRSVPGTLLWYRDKAREFQYNPGIAYFINFNQDNRPAYTVAAPQDRIITQAAAIETFNNVLTIKVAKTGAGQLVPLNPAELQAFKDYMLSIKFAGTRLKCVSLPPDLLTVQASIYYDPIAPLNVVSTGIQTALNTYLTQLDFNGILYLEKIQDAMQQVAGLVSVELTGVSVDYGNGNVPIHRYHQTLAGYCTVNPLTPLSSTITYIASNI